MDLGKSFFPGQRIKLTLDDYHQLAAEKPKEGKEGKGKRKKLHLSLEFTGDRVAGMPEWVYNGYLALAQDKNYIARMHYSDLTQIEQITVTFYSNSDASALFSPLASSILEKFQWVKEGREEKARFWLLFKAEVIDTAAIHDFCKNNYGAEFYANFDQPQEVLDFEKAGREAAASKPVIEGEYQEVSDEEGEQERVENQSDDDDDEDYSGKEHDEDFRSTPLVSAAKRRQQRPVTQAR
jgi:hypothetical protein